MRAGTGGRFLLPILPGLHQSLLLARFDYYVLLFLVGDGVAAEGLGRLLRRVVGVDLGAAHHGRGADADDRDGAHRDADAEALIFLHTREELGHGLLSTLLLSARTVVRQGIFIYYIIFLSNAC